MQLKEMRQAISEAENTMNRADYCATDLAKLLKGRLRQVDVGWNGFPLKELKKELQNFNAVTGKWKD